MKKSFIFILVLSTLVLLLLSLGFVNSSTSGNKVDKKIYDSLNGKKSDSVRVIVKMNEYTNLNFKNAVRKSIISNIDSLKIKREFSSFNGFSASLNSAEIEKLSNDANVEGIYLDKKVYAFLQQSVPLVNATSTWTVNINGTNLTGEGQTVCVIDTGVNYTHSDFGGCNPIKYTLNGTNESYVLQSAHNYTDNFDYTWSITMPGYSRIAVHFSNLSLECTYDYLYVFDENKNFLGMYSCSLNNFWTPSVNGSTIYIRLKTDSFVTDYGFYIDQVINGTTNVTYNWNNCSKVIGGWNMFNYGPDPMDDHGHGTHVSGIIAADGNIKGVAPKAKIVSIKALGADGVGYNGDIAAGIEWCTNRSNDLNISVISMSLGEGLFSDYCDSYDPVTTSAINFAISKNISVIIASGNGLNNVGPGRSDSISAPACIQNAIPVSSVTKSDVIDTSYADRNHMVQLFAPGSSINSTWINGKYALDTGTSMAAPHVAGAFVIMNEYLKLKGQTKTPQQIENIFHTTGKKITDSANSSQNFSRIDIYAAIASLDELPTIDFLYPTESSSLINRNNILVNLSSSSLAVKNITLRLYNSTLNLINSSTSFTSSLFFNFTNLSSGIYYFNATVYTTFGNFNITETRNVTIDTIYPTFFNNSIDGQLTRYTNFNLNITFLDNLGLNTARLESNHTGNLLNYSYGLNLVNQNLSVLFNLTTLAKSFSYRWIVNDSAGNINSTFAWQTVNIVNTAPLALNISNQSWVMNSNFSLNLSQYFSDLDGNELNYTNNSDTNIRIIVNQNTKIVTLIPTSDWNGTSYVEFVANDSMNTTTSNNITLYVFKPIIFVNTSIFDGAFTTNFSNLTSFINVSIIIEKNNTGMINFTSADLSNQTIDLSYVNISYNYIEINSSALPGFNKNALLTLMGLSFTSPMILRDGINCTSCSRLDYTNGTLLFNVTGFSVYTTREDPRCGDSICESTYGETCSSCAGDCGVCPPSGGSPGGGGGILVKAVNKTNNQTNLTLGSLKVNIFNNTTDNETVKTGENNNPGSLSARAQLIKAALEFAMLLVILGIALGVIIHFFKPKPLKEEQIEKNISKKKKR